MKVLKIISCTDSLMWYRYKVGDTVDFLYEDSQYYWSRDNGGYKNIVHKKDGLIVEVELDLTHDQLNMLIDIVNKVDCKHMVRTTYDHDVELAIKEQIVNTLRKHYE